MLSYDLLLLPLLMFIKHFMSLPSTPLSTCRLWVYVTRGRSHYRHPPSPGCAELGVSLWGVTRSEPICQMSTLNIFFTHIHSMWVGWLNWSSGGRSKVTKLGCEQKVAALMPSTNKEKGRENKNVGLYLLSTTIKTTPLRKAGCLLPLWQNIKSCVAFSSHLYLFVLSVVNHQHLSHVVPCTQS